MTETEFLNAAEATFSEIEALLEQAANDTDLDVECSRSGNVMEIECVDNGTKIIVNTQAPMQEIWVAAKSGGFHYRHDGSHWKNTRDGSELFSALSRMLTEQSGTAVVLKQSRP